MPSRTRYSRTVWNRVWIQVSFSSGPTWSRRLILCGYYYLLRIGWLIGTWCPILWLTAENIVPINWMYRVILCALVNWSNRIDLSDRKTPFRFSFSFWRCCCIFWDRSSRLSNLVFEMCKSTNENYNWYWRLFIQIFIQCSRYSIRDAWKVV